MMQNCRKVIWILLASAAATSAMTTFSYVVSAIKKDNYREPELLTYVLDRSVIDSRKNRKASWLGWLVHYGVGFFFCLGYEAVRRKNVANSTLKNDSIFGAVISVISISSWSMLFKLHSKKPRINFRNFYRQLIVAHLPFGLVFVKLSAGKNRTKTSEL